jgi:hypothetical protein
LTFLGVGHHAILYLSSSLSLVVSHCVLMIDCWRRDDVVYWKIEVRMDDGWWWWWRCALLNVDGCTSLSKEKMKGVGYLPAGE